MFLALFMGILGAVMLPFAFTLQASKTAFEKRRQAFLETGKGKDPALAPAGPHRTFARNAMFGFGLFFCVGLGLAIAVTMAS